MDIPQDIIDSVIAAVGDDTRVLKECTLVSSSFLLPSRKQLFSKISLKSDKTCRGIYQFLVQNPVIQSSVRAIIIIEHIDTGSTFPNWINGPSLLAILRLPFCCLESFSIMVENCWLHSRHWKSFSTELRDALSIHLPLNPFTSLPSSKYQLPSTSTLSTLRHWCCIPSRRLIFMSRTQTQTC